MSPAAGWVPPARLATPRIPPRGTIQSRLEEPGFSCRNTYRHLTGWDLHHAQSGGPVQPRLNWGKRHSTTGVAGNRGSIGDFTAFSRAYCIVMLPLSAALLKSS